MFKNYQSRKRGASFIITITFLLSLVPCSYADTIKLKDGRQISGMLQKIDDRDVFLEVGPGTIWFRKEQVESINGLSVEEVEATLATRDAFIMQDKNKTFSSSANEGLVFIAKTRKLEFKITPEIEVVNKPKIKEHLQKNIDKQYSPERLEAKAKLLETLGLIQEIEDYKKRVLDLLGEEIAGYYDVDDKKIYINKTKLGPMLPGLPNIVLMHEQVHALQDQYHDLSGLTNSMLLENEDKALAMQSIIEGEATVLMYDAFFRSAGGKNLPRAFDMRSFAIDSMLAYSKHFKTEEGHSAIFMEGLLFPYVWGGSFIQHLVNTKGWESVDAIYLDMPVSSEQIMHPEKYYIARDEPQRVNFPDLSVKLGNSWIALTKGTLGEFSFYLIGKKFLDDLSAKVMSEGWGGDYFELYEEAGSKRIMLLLLSKWDSSKDAEEFFQIYKKTMEKKYKNLSTVKEDKNFIQYKTEKGNAYIGQLKDNVIVIEGATENLLPILIEALTI